MNLVFVAFLPVYFSIVCALHVQLVEFETIFQHKDCHGDLKATQNLVDDTIKCINKCGRTEYNVQFGFIKFVNHSILVNFSLQDECCNHIMVQNTIPIIAVSKYSKSIISKLLIHGFLSSFHISYSICNSNSMCNNTSVVTNLLGRNSIFQFFICRYGNNASKVTICLNENRNIYRLCGDVNINNTFSRTNLRMPRLQRIKRTQESNVSLHCPLGFKAFYNECGCDPKLVSALPLIQCAKSQLLRPPMTWIGCEKNCTQILYSKKCFIDYCLLTASHLQLNASRIDTQCNYGRTGHICGHCHKGYDSVFGAKPKCKKCSSIWLLLIPVFGIAGFLLVIALFILELTVTKGLINGFVLYTNIVDMENMSIFPSNRKLFLPILVDISNLDLGIEACFYKGMTEFDKHWLQLVFPLYLVCIVGLIAIASRYSAMVEKLTRKRVIPVLATLLFLSYNKLILTTTTVLFYFQPVYHLETNKYELFWPVDTSISLFDVKFILLFAVCLLIFIVFLVPINVVLLFPTCCFKFKKVVYFKPFIDAFQAPYRDKVRYTIGIELLVRLIVCIFNSINFIDYYQKFGANTAIFLLYFSYITLIQPYKDYYKTVLHWSFILNLGFILCLQIYRFSYISESSYLVLLHIVVLAAYVEFAGIVIYEASKFALAHSEILRNIVYSYIIRRAESQQEIQQPQNIVNLPDPIEYEDFQEELLRIDLNY